MRSLLRSGGRPPPRAGPAAWALIYPHAHASELPRPDKGEVRAEGRAGKAGNRSEREDRTRATIPLPPPRWIRCAPGDLRECRHVGGEPLAALQAPQGVEVYVSELRRLLLGEAPL